MAAESPGHREPDYVLLSSPDRAGLPDDAHTGPRGLIQRLAYLSAAAQVVRAAAVALLARPCVTLARSEVPRDPRESEDRRRFPDISHHARAGLTRQECQEPLHRVTAPAGGRQAGAPSWEASSFQALCARSAIQVRWPRCIGQMISASGSTTLLLKFEPSNPLRHREPSRECNR